MKEHMEAFIREIAANRVEIYNEFSLQHELGIFLRSKLTENKIQFERNVSNFGYNKANFTKKEIDITVLAAQEAQPLECAVELKFSQNGQVPEQMYAFCEDIAFLEELRGAGCKRAFFLALTDNKLFWCGRAQNGIYTYFRSGNPLTGAISKPTGETTEVVTLRGKYKIEWKPVCANMMYLLIEV